MTQLSDIFDPMLLQNEIAAGYVKANRHPTLPLTIYTYARECQYEGRWNAVTTQCRGLIADDLSRIVARPFPKFFNVGEHGVREYAPPLPVEPFEVYSKMDGSLGIIFMYQDYWYVASKGSFISEQAQWAQRQIDSHYDRLSGVDPDLTYCVEIIYPENRIVVNYGDWAEMFLLAAFRKDGTEVHVDEVEPYWYLGDVVTRHKGIDNLAQLLEHTTNNRHLDGSTATGTDAEGFVLRFQSGVRAKAKFTEYVRLHRLLTGITERDIWRAWVFDDLVPLNLSVPELARTLKCSEDEVVAMIVSPEGAVATIIEGCPDEFDAWVKGVTAELQRKYDEQDVMTEVIFDTISKRVGTADRGTFARELDKWYGHLKTAKSSCFAILDGKPYAPLIWRSLYPAASTPFKEDDQ